VGGQHACQFGEKIAEGKRAIAGARRKVFEKNKPKAARWVFVLD